MNEQISAHILELPPHLLSASWAAKIEFLFENQLETWNMARNHYRQFESVQRRTIEFDGFELIVQHNPARARSTCADLSKPAIESRPCFLCAANLPADQKGFPLLDRYLLLVNPFPIFERHLTISDFAHTPQNIANRLNDMLQMARLLEGFTVFYNGPLCGASAPDHFHFQAVQSGEMPIEKELIAMKENLGKILVNEEDIQISIFEKYLREVVLFESTYAEPIDFFFEQMVKQLPTEQTGGEPMMNLLASFQNGNYRLLLFPRKAQRPQCYFRSDKSRILVSPASVELGGVVVTPREEDFNKITKADLEQIFGDVSLKHTFISPI